MITTKKKVTNVNFATDKEIGTISIGVKRSLNAIALQQVNPEVNKQVGSLLNESEVQDLPKVLLNFNNTESIDVLMAALQALKNHMTTPPMDYSQYALAC